MLRNDICSTMTNLHEMFTDGLRSSRKVLFSFIYERVSVNVRIFFLNLRFQRHVFFCTLHRYVICTIVTNFYVKINKHHNCIHSKPQYALKQPKFYLFCVKHPLKKGLKHYAVNCEC